MKQKKRYDFGAAGKRYYKRRRKPSKALIAVLALTVAVLTLCAMILPAMTLSPEEGIAETVTAERRLICGNDDASHTHTDECFAQAEETVSSSQSAEKSGGAVGEEPLATESPVDATSGEEVELADDDLERFTEFSQYLSGVGGSIESLLYDRNNNLIENIYEASGQGYTYVLRMYSPYVMPDSYYFYLPKSMDVDFAFKTGEISNGNSSIGTYEISDDSSYILFTFGEETSGFQSISGQIMLSVSFEERIEASVSKTGWLISPEGVCDGYFHFDITAQIPADREGLAEREWRFSDRSEVTTQWVHDFGAPENAANTHVYISYGDVKDREIFDLRDVFNDPSESIAFYTDPESKYLYLVNRCKCENSELRVDSQNGACYSELLKDYPEWGTCWCLDENATVRISYKNAINGADGTSILANQNNIISGDVGNYENRVFLTGSYKDSSNNIKTETHKSTANVEFGSFVEKQEISHANRENGYTSEFRVTFNKSMADLSKLDRNGDGVYDSEAVLTDEMSSMKYISGSMKITADDGSGTAFALTAGTDFTVEAVQTENGTRLTILLTKLGRYRYQLEYSAQVFAEKNQKTVEISNSAGFKLYNDDGNGNDPSFKYTRRFSYDEQWDFVKFEVGVLKVDYEDDAKTLDGAEFGLYASDGKLIAKRTTSGGGKSLFATNAAEGLIFKTGTMYYLQEINAPKGYDINTAKYWFYFGETEDSALEQQIVTQYPGTNISFITAGDGKCYSGEIRVTDEKLFTLPETGAGGTVPYIIAGAALTAVSAGIFIFRRRLKTH